MKLTILGSIIVWDTIKYAYEEKKGNYRPNALLGNQTLWDLLQVEIISYRM